MYHSEKEVVDVTRWLKELGEGGGRRRIIKFKYL